ncbi:MAG TPA: hypothetical protein VL197_04450 [Nitrospirota bacterium]|nr:hypothetical protein [Nitrospirota bacterium]
MNRTAVTTFAFLIFGLQLMSVHQSAQACQVDEFYLTKEGPLAASTPQILNEATKYEEGGDNDKLAGLLDKGSVLRLKGDIKVQVLERSFEFKTLKIKFSDRTDPYWVKDGSLKQIICN